MLFLIPLSSISTTHHGPEKNFSQNLDYQNPKRQEIEVLLDRFRIISVDDAIAEKYWMLLKKYESQGLRQADAIVAATAWQKNFPLLTRNQRHFRFIGEIELAPVYGL